MKDILDSKVRLLVKEVIIDTISPLEVTIVSLCVFKLVLNYDCMLLT